MKVAQRLSGTCRVFDWRWRGSVLVRVSQEAMCCVLQQGMQFILTVRYWFNLENVLTCQNVVNRDVKHRFNQNTN